MTTIAQYKEVKRVAVLLPAYNETETITDMVLKVRLCLPDVIVVDDASTDKTAIQAEAAGATVIHRTVNGGKGASLTEGFKYVLKEGFDAVIAMDSDGFHGPKEIQKFLDTYHRTHLPVLMGNRMGGERQLTPIRWWTVRAMSYWLDRLLGVYVPDPPCGFRFYRCDVLPFLLQENSSLPAEFETLLNIALRRIRVGSVRITKCSLHHKSFISPFRDLIRFARVMHKYHRRRVMYRTRQTS